ncbi:MAG: CHAT domain-containing protein [Acidobacteria bacterium]|nr:MAG: CHAT domain-containing protein [Acidobacteriota bacterium]
MLAALAAASPACAPSSPDFDRAAAALESCPRGDAAWRAALDAARREERTEELLALARRLADGPCASRWEAAWAAGEAAKRLGLQDEARRLFERALARARRLDDAEGISCCEAKIGWLDFLAGQPARAEAAMREAIEAARRAGRIDLESFAHNNLAGVLADAGRWAEAEREMRAARAGLARAGLEDAARGAAYNGAVLLLLLGDAEGARIVLEQAHTEAVAAGDGWTADATAITLGNVYRALERLDEATAWYARVGGDRPAMRARALLGRARVALRRGAAGEALALLEEASALARDEDRVLYMLVEIYRAVARAQAAPGTSAAARLREIAREAEQAGAGQPAWVARWLLGREALHGGEFETARAELRRATQRLVEERARLGLRRSGLRFLRERFEPFVDLAAAELGLADGDPGTPGDAAAARLLAVFGAARGWTVAADDEATLRARGLRDALAPDELLVAFLVGEERTVTLAATHERWLAWQGPGRGALVEPLRRYRRALVRGQAADAGARADGRRLAALLAPLSPRLASARRLWLVPDRELALVPFAELPWPEADGASRDDRRLGDAIEIGRLTRPAPPPRDVPRAGPVLLAGVPRLASGQGLADLAWSAWELDHVADAWSTRAVEVLVGESFRDDTLLRALDKGPAIVHVASHAVASTADPERAGIVLSGGRYLRPPEIRTLPLRRALVVLSACRTGEGELVPGAGVIGLSSAFAEAGAGGIVMSLWTVDDAATARLMVAFHDHLRRGRDPVAALAAARRSVRATASPGAASPFVVVLVPGP